MNEWLEGGLRGREGGRDGGMGKDRQDGGWESKRGGVARVKDGVFFFFSLREGRAKVSLPTSDSGDSDLTRG